MEGLPDYRKSLQKLNEEWRSCTDCSLGVYREEVGGSFVFGEGARRAVMFIGEGPGANEENAGRPFVGKSGKILREAVSKLHIPSYFSNLVCCRSCGRAYDREGNPKYRKDRYGRMYPMIQDMPPMPVQVAACAPRLNEEIYLVDPILIVALGAEAAKALSRSAVSILSESGEFREISIPGAGFHPALTAKKQAWVRKVKGSLVMPVEQNTVRYLMMPLIHPAYLARRSSDARHGNPLQQFVEGMKKIAGIYQRYVRETSEVQPQPTQDLTEGDILNIIEED